MAYDTFLKVIIKQEYLENPNMSLRTLEREHQVHHSTIANWLREDGLLVHNMHENWGNRSVQKVCACGKLFSSFPAHERRFCSPECYSLYSRGRQLSEKSRMKRSVSMKSKPWTEERQQQLDGARLARRFDEDWRAKIRVARLRQKPQPKSATSIELAFYEAMDKAKLNYQKQIAVCECCIPDAALYEEKIAIFIDGDYWHTRPEIIKRDLSHDRVLLSQGWQPMHFWGSEIEENPEVCVLQIMKEVKMPEPKKLPPVAPLKIIVSGDGVIVTKDHKVKVERR